MSEQKDEATINMELHSIAKELANNAVHTRSELMKSLIDGGGKDLDESCGYPTTVKAGDYDRMYRREGIAARVVDVWPEECWSSLPQIYETEDEVETEFERALKDLIDHKHLFHFLERVDKSSGVGEFGVLLVGIDDGLELHEPVEGMNEEGERISKTEKGTVHKLIYLRPFRQNVVHISETEMDVTNARFGLPKYYSITFRNEYKHVAKQVHWHRVLHVADNRQMSETHGSPRMEKSWNRLLDIRKVLGGSAEMFWKGGFPGISFEVKNDGDVELDRESLRNEMESYMLGLQRYLAMEGVTAKSLAPQVSDPKNHLEAQLNATAIAEGIPKRILFGSEQGELASTQDSRTWNRRLAKRQNNYLTPMLVRPFVDRLIALGVLPYVETYFVVWQDLNTQTNKDKAEVAKSWAEALSKYVTGGVEEVMPLEQFLSILASLSVEEIRAITDALKDVVNDEVDDDLEDDDEEIEEIEEE